MSPFYVEFMDIAKTPRRFQITGKYKNEKKNEKINGYMINITV